MNDDVWLGPAEGRYASMPCLGQMKRNRLTDLPPENESSFMLDWEIRKGASNSEEILHTGADSQQAA